MKKVIILLLIISTFVALTAQKNNKASFRLISTKKIQLEKTTKVTEHGSDYLLGFKPGEDLYVKEITLEYTPAIITWNLQGEVISEFPPNKYKENEPIYRFSDPCFLSKSKMWAIPYEYLYPEDYSGAELNSGILLMSEDGKAVVKDIKINDFMARSCVFNAPKQEVRTGDYINYYTDADVFLYRPYLMTAYGEILYTFPENIDMIWIYFLNDGQYMHFYDDTNEIHKIYTVNNTELVYMGKSSLNRNFAASSDKKRCAIPDRERGQITVFKMDANTHQVLQTYNTFVYDIPGVPCNMQIVIDENTGNTVAFYNIKVRFQEGTNHLIITTDDLYESVVEVNFEN
ncbi:MAG: hypothetical protein KA886_03060 [Candidatus Cloacimonetes bacterium]|nr:hypothetical protein [Candidatus Cloacimonadota bacterium]